jgi:hypothetical protein
LKSANVAAVDHRRGPVDPPEHEHDRAETPAVIDTRPPTARLAIMYRHQWRDDVPQLVAELPR